MLAYERQIVEALLTEEDPALRRAVVDHVDAALAAMPEPIRLGLAAETVALSAWATGRRWTRRSRSPGAQVAWLDVHPVGVVRQWVRALRSLVLYAENEMAP